MSSKKAMVNEPSVFEPLKFYLLLYIFVLCIYVYAQGPLAYASKNKRILSNLLFSYLTSYLILPEHFLHTR